VLGQPDAAYTERTFISMGRIKPDKLLNALRLVSNMSTHIIEALGKTRVVIKDGKVVEVGKPEVEYCPLFAKVRDIQVITPEIVKENIEFRIKDFGMCTPQRKMRMRDFLSFGVSELLGMAVSKGMLDCAVIVCEGAGTVVVSDPELIQGIGGRISGIVETSPIPEIIEAIGKENVLDTRKAKVDQLEGVRLALIKGYKRVGVSIAIASDAKRIRDEFGQKVAIFAVHTSGRTAEEAEVIFDTCDIVTGCASKNVRAAAKDRALMQVGNKVPIYAASLWGEHLLKVRLEMLGNKNVTSPEDPPRPLV
jgi:putative methanogenesis marker protein 8